MLVHIIIVLLSSVCSYMYNSSRNQDVFRELSEQVHDAEGRLIKS